MSQHNHHSPDRLMAAQATQEVCSLQMEPHCGDQCHVGTKRRFQVWGHVRLRLSPHSRGSPAHGVGIPEKGLGTGAEMQNGTIPTAGSSSGGPQPRGPTASSAASTVQSSQEAAGAWPRARPRPPLTAPWNWPKALISSASRTGAAPPRGGDQGEGTRLPYP